LIGVGKLEIVELPMDSPQLELAVSVFGTWIEYIQKECLNDLYQPLHTRYRVF